MKDNKLARLTVIQHLISNNIGRAKDISSLLSNMDKGGWFVKPHVSQKSANDAKEAALIIANSLEELKVLIDSFNKIDEVQPVSKLENIKGKEIKDTDFSGKAFKAKTSNKPKRYSYKAIPVRVIGVLSDTSRAKDYQSISQAAMDLHCAKSSIWNNLKNGGLMYGRYQIMSIKDGKKIKLP